MRRVTVASIIALGFSNVTANAQTVIYDPNYQPQGQILPTPQPDYGQQPAYVDPNLQQPYGQQVPQPNYGQTLPQPQPNYGQTLPQPQPNYGQPLPQPQPSYNQQPAYSPPSQISTETQSDIPYYQLNSVSSQQSAQQPPAEASGQNLLQPSDTGPIVPPTISDRAREVIAPAPISNRGDRAPDMSAELSELVRVGERYRAASPGFLSDLKALAEKYRQPLPGSAFPEGDAIKPLGQPGADAPSNVSSTTDANSNPLTQLNAGLMTGVDATPEPEPVTFVEPLSSDSISTIEFFTDDFTDGDFTLNPEWRVRQGEWQIDPVYGLRSVSPEDASNDPVRAKDILKMLLSGEAQDQSDPSPTKAALIELQQPVGAAFSLAARIVDHEGQGAAHFIMHQGGADWLGYRLELRSGPRPVMVLTRRGASGYKDISKVSVPGFTKGKTHELRWARLSDGQMYVLLDGRPVITSRDTVFRQGYSGFAFFNAGGDVSIRTIRVAKPIER